MTLGNDLYGLKAAKPPTPGPSRFRKLLRIPVIILVLMLASLGTMTLIGGNSESMKKLIEDYISESTGTQAEIGTLHRFGFYPEIALDVADVSLKRDGREVAYMGQARFSIGFWSIATGRTRFRTFSLQDAYADPGIILPRAVVIKNMGIDPEKESLILEGTYGGEPVSIQLDLDRRTGPAGIPSYYLAKNADVVMAAGDINIRSTVRSKFMAKQEIVFHEIRSASAGPVSGTLRTDGALQGNVKLGDSDFDFDIPYRVRDDIWNLEGEISGGVLQLSDMTGARGLIALYSDILDFFYGPEITKTRAESPYDLTSVNADISLHWDRLTLVDGFGGPFDGRLSVEGQVFSINGKSADLNGGTMTGSMMLDAGDVPAKLTLQADVDSMDYTALQDHVKSPSAKDGRMDLRLDISSNGNNAQSLWTNLDGRFMAVAGPGEMTSSLVNLWGGGLLNAMFPRFDNDDSLRMNCGVGSFRISGPGAKAEMIMVDTDKVTIAGEGDIDIREATLDIRLSPKSKDLALLSVATSVSLTGPAGKPVIKPVTTSLIKKLGGIFLGTINPAFLVFTLTDLGLTDDHPCRQYLEK